MTPLRVLYVDDDPALRAMAMAALQLDLHLDVKIAGSGEEALSVLDDFQADALLLDVRLPGLDGPGVLSQLRACGRPMPGAVIFVTGGVMPQELARLKALQIQGIVAKPYNALDLSAFVRSVIDAPATGQDDPPQLRMTFPSR